MINAVGDKDFRKFAMSSPKKSMQQWLFKKVLVSGLLAATFALVLFAWSVSGLITALRATATFASKTHEVSVAFNTLQANLAKAETAERGYVIAGSSDSLAPYEEAVEAINWNLALIRALTSGHPPQGARMTELEHLVKGKLLTQQLVVDARSDGGALPAQLLLSERQDELEMQRIQRVLDQMESAENRLLDQKIVEREAAYRHFWWTFGILAGLLLTAVVWQYLKVRNIVQASEESKARILHLAEHDALTGLANRRLLKKKMEHAIACARRDAQMIAVMFIDLDGFKQVNDGLGHQAGDMLLKAVSERLRKSVRAHDAVARLGGDEFVVVASHLNEIHASQLARQLVDAISRPYLVEGGSGQRPARVSASIGISFYPRDGKSPDVLLAKADHALNQAKGAGKNQFQLAVG